MNTNPLDVVAVRLTYRDALTRAFVDVAANRTDVLKADRTDPGLYRVSLAVTVNVPMSMAREVLADVMATELKELRK